MDKLERYIEEFSAPEEALLTELDRQTNLRAMQPRMISGHVQGKFLEMLTRMLRPHSILEIGTFTGYSALCFAAGLADDGFIDTVEIDDELEELARSFFDRSQHGHKIRFHIGSALEVVPELHERYDLVYIDGDKRQYVDYYDMLMGDGVYAGNPPVVHSGSYIIADNILWYGKVVENVAHNDHFTQKILEFNTKVRRDVRVENVIVPLRDGLNLIRVK